MRTIMAAILMAAGALAGAARAGEAPAGGAWAECQVTAVAAFRDRVELRCAGAAADLSGGEGVPREFAVETLGPLTEPTLRLAIAAKDRARPLGVLYVKDAAANPGGCAADRCRRIAGIELR